ncbi:MAG: DUF4386 domain-containing protein [Candidatus Saliniplasma sp.]
MEKHAEEKWTKHRKTAIIVGVLFIIGTVAGILSLVFSGPVVDVPDYLDQVAAHSNRLILAALCVLTMSLSLALIPVVVYPVLRKHNETLALGYVIFRGALETFTCIATVISWLVLITFAQGLIGTGGVEALSIEATGAALKDASIWIGKIGVIVFILGALMFYTVLYRSQLVPRWISGWGLIAAMPFLAAGFLVMFGIIGHMSTVDSLLQLPLALQEMVLAVWLIVKGFNPEALPGR